MISQRCATTLAAWMAAALLQGTGMSSGFAAQPPSASAASKAAPAQEDDDLPLSKDELFGTDTRPAAPSSPGAPAAPAAAAASDAPGRSNLKLRGFSQLETTYTYASPSHWSRGVLRTQIEALGQVSETTRWKASIRLDVDPVIGNSSFYPEAVKRNQRDDFMIRETYVDTTVGDWELRLGRQHIVWGEVVGLFFADVVSARDLRDYILPEFDVMRIPQWATRAEYFKGDAHLELIWIPVSTLDNIGKPGAEFYPLQYRPPAGVGLRILNDDTPARTLSNSNYGARLSYLYKGWDMAGFYYRSTSSYPTFYRQLINAPGPVVEFTPKHDRIWQVGGTVSKDLGSVVLRAETVFTGNKGFEVTRLSEQDGVVRQNTLDYIVSLDFVPFRDGRLNVQAFQRVYFDHDPDILYDRYETGVSVLLSGKINARWEPEILIIQSVNRDDRLLRPRIKWYPVQNATVIFGVDIFAGPAQGEFGRFANRDRIYAEARYAF